VSGPGGFQTVLNRTDFQLNQNVLVGIRPEHLSIEPAADGHQRASVTGTVHETVYKGSLMEVLIKTTDDHIFRAAVSPRSLTQKQIESGRAISLVLEKDFIQVFQD
jgi:ABC-type Fe3+/spermidine/putrescine transport system ATPase subunit